MNPHVAMMSSPKRTQVLVTLGKDEVLRANLPPLNSVRQDRAVTTLLQGLSLWLDERLCVALSAAWPESYFRCDLTDEMGVGARSVFYVVEVVEQPGRRRGARIRGLGDFQAVRQLSLLCRCGGAR